MYSVKRINKHALVITITKSKEVRFSIQFLLMLHHRFANATQVLLGTSNQVEVAEHENSTK